MRSRALIRRPVPGRAGLRLRARRALRWLLPALLSSCTLSGDGIEGEVSGGGTQETLTVSPTSGLVSFGTFGGPFAPASIDFTLTNIGTAPLDWTASANKPWIQVSSTGGNLAAGTLTTLSVSLDQALAAGLSLGSQVGIVTFQDLTNGGAIGRTVTLNISTSGTSALSPSLTQFGVTWDFDGSYEVGQFANGDWWVVGPVNITRITPVSASVSGRTMNGSMINPSPMNGQTQGYDSDCYGQYVVPGNYEPTANVALGVSAASPLTVPPSSSLISTISEPASGVRPQLNTAAILTVVAAPPPPGSFRPAYCGSTKTFYNIAQLDRSLLGKLAPVASTPPFPTVEAWFERPWIDHVSIWVGNYLHPTLNMPDYGRDMCDQISTAALMLHLNVPDSEKETLLVRFVQLGLDFWGIAQDGGSWPPSAGHMSGRKWPILFAGLVLGDSAMSGVGSNPTIPFGEDGQTFYVQETPPGSGVYNGGYGGYGPQHVGMPEWGTNHPNQPWFDDLDWFGDPYRLCCTANAWWGQLLSCYVMGAKPLWNHDELFDYQDRYLIENQQRGIVDWRLSWRDFYFDMWQAYRANY
jgi:hypothetical protein